MPTLAEQAANQIQSGTAPTREQINRLEAAMLTLPQVDIPVEHTFGPGFYARTIRIPAGTTLTGKIHATEHIFIISEGEILLATEEGQAHVKAPFQTVCRPGLKRVGHALTDVVCTNVHITTETDLAKLEAQLIVSDTLGAPTEQEKLS